MKEIYDILDNGGAPFKCEVIRKENKIKIYKAIYDIEEGELLEYKYIFTRYYKQIFIGDDPLDFSGEGYNEMFIGNSILIKMLNGKYMFIGEVIYEFDISDAKDSDEILDFYSYVGNSGVAYPFAIGKKYSYLFTLKYEKVTTNIPGSKIPRVKIPNKSLGISPKNPKRYGAGDFVTKDLYMQYFNNNIQEYILPFKVKMIHNRL